MDWFQTALNGASSVLNWFSQRDTNNMNKQLTREQMAFQERMSNTAVQRHAKDLEAAGFNRLLAAGANGASTPSGAAATMRAPEITPIDIIGIQQGRANVAKTKAETQVAESTSKNLDEQNKNLSETNKLISAQTAVQQWQAAKIQAEISGTTVQEAGIQMFGLEWKWSRKTYNNQSDSVPSPAVTAHSDDPFGIKYKGSWSDLIRSNVMADVSRRGK